jgi:Na+-driven multidrug efflux pump
MHVYLYLVLVSYAFLAISSFSITSWNALFASTAAVTASLARNFGIVIPSMFAGYHRDGAEGVVIGMAVGNVVSGIALWAFARKRLPGLVTAAALRTI